MRAVAHHRRVGELPAQRLDLDAVGACSSQQYDNTTPRNVRRRASHIPVRWLVDLIRAAATRKVTAP
jgi:hypothetical protein